MYTVKVNRNAVKEIYKIPKNFQIRVFDKIKELSLNPRPSGLRKIKVEEGLWRIRVGKYRIVYLIDDKAKEVEVLYVRKREDAYK